MRNKIRHIYVVVALFVFCHNGKAQLIGNYVSNGSFEELYNDTCVSPLYWHVRSWNGIDSIHCQGGWSSWFSICNGYIPFNGGFGMQYPHSGSAHIICPMYYPINNKRNYPRNRLKYPLQVGEIYCVKFYVNITNNSTYGIDGFGVYFGNNGIDTITTCDTPLTYLVPQIQNPQGNIITDTLNWVPVTGTFTANGTEKYLVLGNFLSNENIDTLMINPTYLPTKWTDVLIDDVSCIPIDLDAYAGRDTTILIGDSVYIGREKDFATDSGCVWYQLPNMTTPIDTISGMWVKPAVTTTYVVRQELECSALKWDTVVVSVKYDVGINEFTIHNLSKSG